MKFNKDTFLNDMTEKVQSAIDKNLITSEDIQSDDTSRLHGFIQYELLEYIEDRKFAIDVLKDFNYDDKTSWDKLQEDFGQFTSLMDIALVNLWKYLDNEGATSYGYYQHTEFDPNKPMLDAVHDFEKSEGTGDAPNNAPRRSDGVSDRMRDNGFDFGGMGETPRRKIRPIGKNDSYK